MPVPKQRPISSNEAPHRSGLGGLTFKYRAEARTTSIGRGKGTWNYYGIIGNSLRMQIFYNVTCRTLHKWLNRRSQRKSMTWSAFQRMLKRFQVPQPRIVEKRNQKMPCQLELSFCQRLMDFLKPSAIQKANASVS